MSAQPLPLTGERTVPGVPEELYWFLRHEVVYHWIGGLLAGVLLQPEDAGGGDIRANVVGPTDAVGPAFVLGSSKSVGLEGLRILDAGCGEGYGADWFAGLGADVVALDYDEAAIAHVEAAYPRVTAVRGNLNALPLPDASTDAVVSLQVIEHIWNLGEFLAECRRVLRPGGVIVVSTPNRPVFSPGLRRGEKPVNPFHVEEFDAEQVEAMLRHTGFGSVYVYGLHHAGAIDAWEAAHGSVVAAHVRAVTSGQWQPELLDLLPQLTAADFTMGATAGAHDLIGVARA